MKKKTGLKGIAKFFVFYFNSINTKHILGIYRYFMKGKQYKIMFGIIKKNVYCIIYFIVLHYYPFAVKLDRCAGKCITLNDLSNKVCVPNKTKDLNLNVFDMITGINELKTLIKIKSYEMEQNVIQVSGGISINVNISVKNDVYVKKIIFWIHLHVAAKIENI